MGTRVLITGATSGIGRDFADLFAEQGNDLYLVSRSKSKLSEVKKEIEDKSKVSVEIMAIDLSNTNSAQELFDNVCRENLEIDILVNNAGFGVQGEHTEFELSKITQMINLNVITLSHISSLFGNEMKKRGGGHILNVASIGAYGPVPYLAAYAATKSYILYFSEALAKELEDYNIVVTCLSPGVTDTNFFNAAGIGDKTDGIWSNKARMNSRKVAKYGIKQLFSGKLSVVPGFMNSFSVFLYRFLPRGMAANMTKKLLKDAR
jgi:short-subunit dehydrogenase